MARKAASGVCSDRHAVRQAQNGRSPREAADGGGRRPGAQARGRIADALTAILLHADAIRRRAAGDDAAQADIADSTRHIADSARSVWRALDDLAPAADTGGTDP